jgi:hypothetical protein
MIHLTPHPGPSGLAFIEETLATPNPPKLTLYVRTPSKLPPDLTSKTRIIEGGLTDEPSLNKAMSDGVDTVVSFLGAYPSLSALIYRTKDTPIADSFPLIIKVMRSNNIKRILALSTPSFRVEGEQANWTQWLYGLFPAVVVPQGDAEMVGIGENVSQAEGMEWTVFRVPHLTDGAGDLPVAAGLLGAEYKGGLSLSRRSMGRWVFGEMGKGEWIGRAPVLGNC